MVGKEQNWEKIEIETQPQEIQCGFLCRDLNIVVAEAAKETTAELEKQMGEELDIPVLCQNLMQQFSCSYLLLLWVEKEEEHFLFLSESRQVRALEFLDYMLPEFGLVKGSGEIANGRISSAILKVQMSEMDIASPLEYYLVRAAEYFTKTHCIEADSYGRENKKELTALPRYVKKRIAWAYVASVEVAEPGTRLCIKSLENPSGMEVIASEDVYIMIGCRGEVYDIKRSKFEHTYETTQEPLDVFASMMDFFPEIQILSTGEYITLDETAHLCYPRQGGGIYACQLEERTKVFPAWGMGDYFLGRPGDFMAVRCDDVTDIYIIRGDIFEDTYELAVEEK